MNILFAGTPWFARAHLESLLGSAHRVLAVITQPDKPGKRGKAPVPGPVKTLATERGIEVLQPRRLKADDIAAYSADVLVVVAFGQILKPDVLRSPRLGCVNVHASLLPRWRGAAPIQRAILAGDEMTGVCTMQMDEGLDTGDVFDCAAVTIDADDSTGSLTRKLAASGAVLLVETLDALASGKAVATPQSTEGVTYAHKIEKHEAALDFQGTAIELVRRVRAFNPDPGAFAFARDLRVRILEASAEEESGAGAPGEILSLDRTGLRIACGRGTLVVTRLQLPVGKGSVLSPADLMNARRPEFRPNERFNAQ